MVAPGHEHDNCIEHAIGCCDSDNADRVPKEQHTLQCANHGQESDGQGQHEDREIGNADMSNAVLGNKQTRASCQGRGRQLLITQLLSRQLLITQFFSITCVATKPTNKRHNRRNICQQSI